VRDTRRSTVVIGAGIGGLAAACRLAAAGLAVTVVEAHGGPGGKMRVRDSPAGPIDIGPTVLTMRPVFEDLFAALGARLRDHVTLTEDPILARHFWPDGSRLDLFRDPGRSARAVAEFAGDREARAFARFSRRAARLFDAFEGPVMRAEAPSLLRLTARVAARPGLAVDLAPGRSLARSLAATFRDRRLRQLFGRYATYVGGSPYESPAVLGLIWRAEADGVWSVAGGMNALARAVHRLAESAGVAFRFNARATHIETRGDRAGAVRLENGDRLAANALGSPLNTIASAASR